MEILNFLFPFNDLILPLTLNKVNKHYFGKEFIKLDSGKDLYDYLVSPSEAVFMRVESDNYEKYNIYCGDIVIIERNHLRFDGPAAVKIENLMLIKEMRFTKDFEIYASDMNNDKNFEYFGTIAYVLQSEEEGFIEMIGQELFVIN